MPLRDISSGFINHLSGEVLSLAVCVKLTRLDGLVMGFTSHDRPLVITDAASGTIVYEARSSIEATAVRQEATSGVDNLEVGGLLQSDRITETDIRAGRYDGAKIEFFLVNFRNLGHGKLILLTGTLGEISTSDGQYTAEIRSLSQRLSQQIGELTSPLCRVKQLGDSRCEVDLTAFRNSRTVSQIDSVWQIRFETDTELDDYYTYGRVIVTSGDNEGFEREVKDHFNSGTDAVCQLQEPFPFDFQIGDEVILEAGCDRQFSTCIAKFDNVLNFRGEPHLPGTDKIIQIGRKQDG